MSGTAKDEPIAGTSSTSEESGTQQEETRSDSEKVTDVLALMMEMPLRDVPARLAALASVIEEANLELSRSVGMAMGAGYHELHEDLIGVGAVYVQVEQALTEWRMALKHNRQEELTEKPGEF